jgi:hypothetical protein
MVDTGNDRLSAKGGTSRCRGHFGRRVLRPTLLAIVVAGASAIPLALHGGSQTVRPATPRSTTSTVLHVLVFTSDQHIGAMKSAGKTTPDSPTIPAAAAAPSAIVPAAPTSEPVAAPSLSTLVAQVEAAGVEPGPNWTWSIGDTSTHCGVVSGAGTGCTYGADGNEYTVFAGTPTLALVAHEMANAETQNDAIPSLLDEVATAAAGSSWSPTDAVASCLVAHLMGFQDNAAGSWQCSNTLATVVAEHIHDTY